MDAAAPTASAPPEAPLPLSRLFLRFLRYGFLAWGGPVAQIALMHKEVVERDRWVTEARFRKVLALYQVLPGPEATELAVYFGMLKRGRLGGLLAGLGFILPGVVLLTLLAALYVAFAGTSAVAGALLYGFKPAVIALIVLAVVRLTRANLKDAPLALVAVGVGLAAWFLREVSFLVLLAAAGLAALALELARPRPPRALAPPGGAHASLAPLAAAGLLTGALAGAAGALALFVVALKAGLLSFGGAYTAIPFLHEGAVVENRWLTEAQFLDAFALSALIPGPLIAVGTFVGFIAGGLVGALVATVGVFAPAFLFTLAGHDFFERIVEEPRLHAFLLGVSAGVIGLIVVASVPLARGAFVDAWTAVIGLGALVALYFLQVRIPFVLGACGLLGILVQYAAA